MTRSGLILAAHGAGDDSEANRTVWTHVRRLGLFGLYDDVTAAFSLGTPRLSEVLDRMQADEVVVLPWDVDGGRFSNELLPVELGQNRRHREMFVRRLPPVGVHPRVVDLVARRTIRCMDRMRLQSERTAVIVLGQTAPAVDGDRGRAESLADQLRDRVPCADIGAALLDAPPTIEQAVTARPGFDLLIVPFAMDWDPRCVRELAARLAIEIESSTPPNADAATSQTPNGVEPRAVGPAIAPPAIAAPGGRQRRIVCEAPLNADPALFDVVLQMARAERGEVAARLSA